MADVITCCTVADKNNNKQRDSALQTSWDGETVHERSNKEENDQKNWSNFYFDTIAPSGGDNFPSSAFQESQEKGIFLLEILPGARANRRRAGG